MAGPGPCPRSPSRDTSPSSNADQRVWALCCPRPSPPPSSSLRGATPSLGASTAPPATRLCSHAPAGHLCDGVGEGVTPPRPPPGPEAPPPAPQSGAGSSRDIPRLTVEDATHSGDRGRDSARGQHRGASHGRAGAAGTQPSDGAPHADQTQHRLRALRARGAGGLLSLSGFTGRKAWMTTSISGEQNRGPGETTSA